MARSVRGRLVAGVSLLVGAVALTLLGAPSAGAQQYPEVPTTAGPGTGSPACALVSEQIEVGSTATVEVTDVGDDSVMVYVGSELVAEQAVGGGSGTITFTVPSVAPGDYDVSIVGPAFTVTCPAVVTSGDQVLGETITRGRGSGSGTLPLTGFQIGMTVIGALVALAVGLMARRGAQRRRQTLEAR